MHKYVVSLVLLGMMLKCSSFKIHIPIVFDRKQFDTKRNYLKQKIRAENWILPKHLHRPKIPHPYWDTGLIDRQALKVLNM